MLIINLKIDFNVLRFVYKNPILYQGLKNQIVLA